MVLPHKVLPEDPHLIYEHTPVDSQKHAEICWLNLALPLRIFLERNGLQAFVGCDSPVAYEKAPTCRRRTTARR
jgi:hypothetical protein